MRNQHRVEADWPLAEEVAAQDQLAGSVTTKADATDGCGAARALLVSHGRSG